MAMPDTLDRELQDSEKFAPFDGNVRELMEHLKDTRDDWRPNPRVRLRFVDEFEFSEDKGLTQLLAYFDKPVLMYSLRDELYHRYRILYIVMEHKPEPEPITPTRYIIDGRAPRGWKKEAGR